MDLLSVAFGIEPIFNIILKRINILACLLRLVARNIPQAMIFVRFSYLIQFDSALHSSIFLSKFNSILVCWIDVWVAALFLLLLFLFLSLLLFLQCCCSFLADGIKHGKKHTSISMEQLEALFIAKCQFHFVPKL